MRLIRLCSTFVYTQLSYPELTGVVFIDPRRNVGNVGFFQLIHEQSEQIINIEAITSLSSA